MPLATRRSYAGAAPACTLSSDISAGATSFSITGTTTNWPTTATGPFYMVIDPGLSTEEKVLVGARTSGSLSSVTRGVDGTTAASHVTGASCYPVFTAVDANDANLLASRLSAKGDLISSDGSDPTKVAVGANNTRLVADSAQTSGIKWVADTQNTVVDAKGDLLVGSANDTVARLAVGTDGHAVVADSNATNGINYSPLTGFRNLIINGAANVDQRATTATVNTGASYSYGPDRWLGLGTASAGVFTLGRSTTVKPDVFDASVVAQCTTLDSSLASGDNYQILTHLEGYNVIGLGYGTSAAKTARLSFWVRSSKTGTYSVSLRNSAINRSLVVEYTISVADTWEYKSLSIVGDTTGTWVRDNGLGLRVAWSLGCGSGGTTSTLGSWQAANVVASTNQVNWMDSQTSRFFYLTGVQLEIGSVATPFEFKSYGDELALCQRYYWRISGATAANVGLANGFGTGVATPSARRMVIPLPVPMRAKPTPVIAGTHWMYNASLTNRGITSLGFNSSSPDRISVDVNSTGATTTGEGLFWVIDSSSANDYLEASGAEL